jgi:phosphate starvation-inducible PhoH-like protein
LDDPSVSLLLGVGPAGTGKTLFACSAAVQEMKRGSIQKIILTRPVIPVEEEELGFLPGNLIHKMNPWTRPMFDVLNEFYNQRDIDIMLQSGAIEISPLAYMRGRTFKRSFVIADEMQNSSPGQMIMLTTRLGEGSKMVITGDLKQSDRTVDNGLADFIKKLNKYSGERSSIKMVEMGVQDIERSPLVSKILDIYDDNHKTTSEVMTIVSKPLIKQDQNIVYNVTDAIIVQDSRRSSNKTTRKLDNDCAMIPNDPLMSIRR